MFHPEAILYIGTRKLGARCLEYLVSEIGCERFAGVLTVARDVTHWWSFENYREVWEVAEAHGLPLVAAEGLADLDYDLLICVLWERILPTEIIMRPALGAINLHPAPLPHYRGSLTRTHAIANGEKTYGVSMHYMVARVDEGDLLAMTKFPIRRDDTAATLDRRTMDYGYPLFCETWQRLCDGSAERIAQWSLLGDNAEAPRTYTMASISGLLERPDRPLTAEEIDRLRHALDFPPKLRPPDWLLENEDSSPISETATDDQAISRPWRPRARDQGASSIPDRKAAMQAADDSDA